MNSKFKAILFPGILALMIVACSPALYNPVLTDSQKTGVSVDTLVMGRKLYVNNCASCHSLYQPGQFTKKEWEKVMPLMQKKSKCSFQETVLITKYLNARSRQN